jgi:hypothetical protein
MVVWWPRSSIRVHGGCGFGGEVGENGGVKVVESGKPPIWF